MPFDYLAFIETTHREARDARVTKEQTWRRSWDLYNNQVDFSKKAKWQSQQVVPEHAQAVDTAGDIVQQALIEAPEFYTIEGESLEDKEKAPLLKRLIDVWLRNTNFQVTFASGIRLAGIVDFAPFKLTWPEWTEQDVQLVPDLFGEWVPRTIEQRRSGLKVELLDPFRVWIDPTGRNRYVLESVETDLDELRRMAAMAPEAWDREEIARLEQGCQDKDAADAAAQRARMDPAGAASWRRPVTLLTFWGDVVDKDGTKVHREYTCAVATAQDVGGKYLVGTPRPIPYWHKILDRRYPNKRGPIIWGSLFTIPLAAYGKGFSDGLGLARLITDQFNNLIDQDTFAGINAFEVDVDAMSDPEQLKDGIYPGIALLKRGDLAGERPILTPKVLGQINQGALPVLHTSRRLYQNSTGVTENIAATEPTRQAPTLGEYRGRQAQAMNKMNMIARNLEDTVLVPMLETAYWLIVQYLDDFGSAPILEALGTDAARLAALSPADRFQVLKASVRFRARGISAVLAKAEEVQKVALLLQALPGLLKVVPGLAATINWQALVRKVIEGFSWDPDEVLLSPQQAVTEQEALLGAQGVQPGVQPVVPSGLEQLTPMAQPGMAQPAGTMY